MPHDLFHLGIEFTCDRHQALVLVFGLARHGHPCVDNTTHVPADELGSGEGAFAELAEPLGAFGVVSGVRAVRSWHPNF